MSAIGTKLSVGNKGGCVLPPVAFTQAIRKHSGGLPARAAHSTKHNIPGESIHHFE